MHYYQHNIGDFASATRLLGPIEIGVAQILIDEYARTEKPLGRDFIQFVSESLTSRYQFVSESQASGCVSLALRSLFVETDDGFVCPMLDEQIKRFSERAEKNRLNASKPRKKKATSSEIKEISESLANGLPVACQSLATNNQEPITNNQINNPLTPLQGETAKPSRSRKPSVEKPDDVSAQTWDDFSALRKAKRAPITATAIDGFRKEAQMAGISLEEALQFSVRQGYQGFKADWYRREERTQNAAPINGAAPKISEDWDSWLR